MHRSNARRTRLCEDVLVGRAGGHGAPATDLNQVATGTMIRILRTASAKVVLESMSPSSWMAPKRDAPRKTQIIGMNAASLHKRVRSRKWSEGSGPPSRRVQRCAGDVQGHDAENADLPAHVGVRVEAAGRGGRVHGAVAHLGNDEHGHLKHAQDDWQTVHVEDGCGSGRPQVRTRTE